ncbi:conserved exported hypothetical protein [Burkholderia sp. 8Y]|uniref:hypothetical protein n=1 Tax=Burkholderia sp. 8Y TaxID=2653133 RepID=UPI0012F43BE0|nr:hypothetical protein [Burkholderia sp. 8Y]VXA97243.1 conserved exported hypothetical protein [Burkholderia sp. 8Y]
MHILRFVPSRLRSARTLAATALVSSLCAAAYAHAEAQCPGYVETDAGSAFDVAAIVKDSGSPQSALERVRRAVSKIDAGGGCSIFANVHACEETLTLARKAIVALQACAAGSAPKNTTRG